jgi:hypothetical protein
VLGAAAVGGAVATDTLDDALRAAGVRPKPEPDPGDLRLTARARADAVVLVDIATAAEDVPADVLTALREQRDSLPSTLADASAVGGELAQACLAVSRARADEALTAVSVDLAQVLASLSAGLAQCHRRLVDA